MPLRTALVAALFILGACLAAPAIAKDASFDRAAFDTVIERVGDVCATRTVARGPARTKDLRFFIAPYGWLASVKGSAWASGEETEFEIPFSDIAEHVNGGFQLYAELRWRKWFIAFDGTWAKLQPTLDIPLFDVDLDITQRIFDVRVGYEVLRCTLDGHLDPRCEGWRRWIVADVFVGLRYWYTKLDVSLKGQGPIGIEGAIDGVDERWDPFVGARFGIDLTRRWSLVVRGDVGGFGIEDAAQLTWQVQGGVSYDVTQWMHVFMGWRAIGSDLVVGSGADKNGTDLIQHGPLFGLGFSF